MVDGAVDFESCGDTWPDAVEDFLGIETSVTVVRGRETECAESCGRHFTDFGSWAGVTDYAGDFGAFVFCGSYTTADDFGCYCDDLRRDNDIGDEIAVYGFAVVEPACTGLTVWIFVPIWCAVDVVISVTESEVGGFTVEG